MVLTPEILEAVKGAADAGVSSSQGDKPRSREDIQNDLNVAFQNANQNDWNKYKGEWDRTFGDNEYVQINNHKIEGNKYTGWNFTQVEFYNIKTAENNQKGETLFQDCNFDRCIIQASDFQDNTEWKNVSITTSVINSTNIGGSFEKFRISGDPAIGSCPVKSAIVGNSCIGGSVVATNLNDKGITISYTDISGCTEINFYDSQKGTTILNTQSLKSNAEHNKIYKKNDSQKDATVLDKQSLKNEGLHNNVMDSNCFLTVDEKSVTNYSNKQEIQVERPATIKKEKRQQSWEDFGNSMTSPTSVISFSHNIGKGFGALINNATLANQERKGFIGGHFEIFKSTNEEAFTEYGFNYNRRLFVNSEGNSTSTAQIGLGAGTYAYSVTKDPALSSISDFDNRFMYVRPGFMTNVGSVSFTASAYLPFKTDIIASDRDVANETTKVSIDKVPTQFDFTVGKSFSANQYARWELFAGLKILGSNNIDYDLRKVEFDGVEHKDIGTIHNGPSVSGSIGFRWNFNIAVQEGKGPTFGKF